MTKKLSIIVASGEVNRFQEWLNRSYTKLASNSSVHIVFVPWGESYFDLTSMAERHGIKPPYLDQEGDTNAESNKNRALKFIKDSPPQYVGFLDDDAFLDVKWLDAIFSSIESNKSYGTLISLVRDGLSKDKNHRDYAGHYILRGRPSPFRYPDNSKSYVPLGPCACCAVISWEAIKQIYEKQKSWDIWDPEFNNTPETCVDFSVKLALVEACPKIVSNACVTHKDQSIIYDPDNSSNFAKSRLKSRILLYYKYLEGQALNAGRKTIESDKPLWKKQGVFAYSDRATVVDIESFLSSTEEYAQKLVNNKYNHYQTWRDIMRNSGKSSQIFHLSH